MPTLLSLRGTLRAASVFVAALALVVAVPHGAFAAPGDLDTTFGTGGKVTVDGAFSDGQDLAVQADGRIVTVGARQDPDTFYADFSVMRHNADGSVDTTFGGGDGEVLTDFEQGEDRAQGVTLQPDGKIVVVGRTQRTADEFAGCCWLTVARYNSDGSLDTTFGGTGWVVPELAGGAEEGWAVAVQPDGKILAAGSAGGTFTAVRFNTNGTLDPTFDGDGKVLTSFQDVGGAQGFDMALQPNGKFVIVGYSGETSFDFALARYNSNGSLDTSFGGDGRVTTDLGGYNWGRTVAVQSTGKIVASGSSGGNFTLVRYNVDGTLDSGFGTGGVVTTAFGTTSAVEALLIQPDDRIVAAGTAAGVTSRWRATRSTAPWTPASARAGRPPPTSASATSRTTSPSSPTARSSPSAATATATAPWPATSAAPAARPRPPASTSPSPRPAPAPSASATAPRTP